MDYAALFAVFIVVVCFLLLAFTRIAQDIILLSGVCVLLVAGVISPEQAFSGFSNEGTITVALLYVVARGLSATGAASWVASIFLGRPTRLGAAQLRLMLPVAFLSSLVNNTPIVAMMIPAVIEWAKRARFPVSQLLMPLSYAAIIGGACTLIGTSTNLVIADMLRDFSASNQLMSEDLGLFELAWVGVPCVIVVFIFTYLFSRKILRHEGVGNEAQFEDVRQYTVEMLVEENSPLVGKTVEEADLRSLPGLFLIEIQRQGHLITAVGPNQKLYSNDRLVFAGNVDSVVDLQKLRGLRPAEDQIFKLESDRSQRHLVEVVLSSNFPQLGKTVKQGKFRTTYGAAIIAIARDGQTLKGKLGDVALRAGDTLLIEAGRSFERQQRYVRDFAMVRRIDDYTPVSHEKMPRSIIIFVAMIILAGFGILSMVQAAFLAAGAMVLTRCLTTQDARQSVNLPVLLVIAASIALGASLQVTGAAGVIAHSVIESIGDNPYVLVTALFALTAGFSALISNVAAAVLLFPVAAAMSAELGVDMKPLAVTIMIAASASFATPIGYQTNLMVYGPGKYRFGDFVKMGVPLTILVGMTTVLIVPQVWPF